MRMRRLSVIVFALSYLLLLLLPPSSRSWHQFPPILCHAPIRSHSLLRHPPQFVRSASFILSSSSCFIFLPSVASSSAHSSSFPSYMFPIPSSVSTSFPSSLTSLSPSPSVTPDSCLLFHSYTSFFSSFRSPSNSSSSSSLPLLVLLFL